MLWMALVSPVSAQVVSNPDAENWLVSPGVLGTLALVVIIATLGILILVVKLNTFIWVFKKNKIRAQKIAFSEELTALEDDEIDAILERRKASRLYKPAGTELGGLNLAEDPKGYLVSVTDDPHNPLVDENSNPR